MGDNADGGMKIKLELIIMLVTIVSAGATFFFWVDSRHASKIAFNSLEHSFETKKLNDFIQQANARAWQLEDRLEDNPHDVSAKEELRTLEVKLDSYEAQYQVLLENAPELER